MNSISDILRDVKTKEDLDNVIATYGLNYQDSNGDSFLHEFSKIGKIELIAHLFDRKRTERYQVNLKNKLGRTALFDTFDEEITEFLLLNRIDYKCKDSEGKMAEEVNPYANFIINQKCGKIRGQLLKSFGLS